MERSRVSELHYMTPIANLSSIMKWGILSQVRASPLKPEPEADPATLWQQIMQLAAEQGMTEDELNEDFAKITGGLTTEHADATDLQRYLDHGRRVARP